MIFRHKRVASPHTGVTHFDRRYLIDTRWGGIMLHWLRRPDHDRDMHDHPYTFASFVLRGEYEEVVPRRGGGGTVERVISWFNFKRATISDPHRISRVAPGTLTFVFFGPRRRNWGFHTDRGWIDYKTYLGLPS